MQLKSSPSNYIYCCSAGLEFQMEEMLKKIEMGFDPQKGLAQVNKDRNVEDGITG